MEFIGARKASGLRFAPWRQLTVRQQMTIALAAFIVLIEIVTLVVESRAISNRIVMRAHTTSIEYATSVFPLLISRTTEQRLALAQELQTETRRIVVHSDPPSVSPGDSALFSMHAEEAIQHLADHNVTVAEIHMSQRVVTEGDGLPHREVTLSVLPEGESQWVTAITLTNVADVRNPLLVTTLTETALAIAVLITILLIVDRMLLPLKSIARNAELLAHGERPDAIPARGGGKDIRATVLSFNQMSKILAQTMDYQRGMLMSLGHDLKSPLNHAHDLVTDGVEDPTRARVLGALERARSVLSLVTEYTRATMRDGQLEIVEISSLLDALIEEAQDRGKEAIGEFDRAVNVHGHYNALTRAFRNLIENAIKYGGSARVKLSVDADYVWIDIEDDGPGIDDEMLEDVLLPFKRISEDTTGTGLGLSISKTIIVDNGGSLKLFNRPEGGLTARATMSIYSPASAARKT